MKPHFEIGQVWEDKSGYQWKIVSVDGTYNGITYCKGDKTYPIIATPTQDSYEPTNLRDYTNMGVFDIQRLYTCENNLVTLVSDAPKPSPIVPVDNPLRHPNADVIHAWAEGEQVQFMDTVGVWNDTQTPNFNLVLSWRVKPKTVIKKFCMALTDQGVIAVDVSDTTQDRQFTPEGFIRWFGDIQTVEVEV